MAVEEAGVVEAMAEVAPVEEVPAGAVMVAVAAAAAEVATPTMELNFQLVSALQMPRYNQGPPLWVTMVPRFFTTLALIK